MKTKIETVKLIIGIFVMMMIAMGVVAQKPATTAGKVEKSPTAAQKSQTDQHPTMPPPPPPPPPPVDGLDDDMPGPQPLNLPDLTDIQKEKIKKSDLKNMEAMTPLKNLAREKRARLMTIVSTPPANMNEADQVADDLGKIMASVIKQQIRHDQEIRSFLTPQQQIVFDSRPKPFLNRMAPGMKGKRDEGRGKKEENRK